MCTLKTKTGDVYTKFSKYGTDLSNQLVKLTSQQSAAELFYLNNNMYKKPDYRCLNPNGTDPEEWGTYDPVELANATSEEELKKVKTYSFDKRFMNFEDPEILKLMVGKKMKKNWKETYGFDFVSYGGDKSEALLDCAKAERSKFAQKCQAQNGMFKCCTSGWNITTYSLTRKMLKEYKLISSYDEDLCDDFKCSIATNVHMCAIRNPFTDLVDLQFKTPLVNPLGGGVIMNSKLGARIDSANIDLRLGLRAEFCIILDTCAWTETMFETSELFMRAYDRQSFCQLKLKNTGSFEESYETDETEEECKKRKYPNIRICPKDKFEKKKPLTYLDGKQKLFGEAMDVLWGNKKLKKKTKKKKTKRKKMKKTKGKKKKKKSKSYEH
ncbi:uncharacterized protein LOC111710493 [Eurytemora carolleeae]|uniref:uncharacterized protein LOC111710493 n=1 Tax=Eurytemora carolleeae TaxID=1294199 RepID=UPI000C776949|nr:uncharacterized protein LOC111710493 [Eurytemora carolleeae]|eukprot:XP_023340364.1 uncharacterized protein LOC111710493 [Eurytemora affinis]